LGGSLFREIGDFREVRRYTAAMKNMAIILLCGLAGTPAAMSQQQESPVIEGYVTRAASGSDFDVNGYRVLCGADTQTTVGEPQSKEVLSNQGCPPDVPYLGEPMKIYGSVKKKRHAVQAERIEAQPVVRGEITGSAVIEALPPLGSASTLPGSLLVRADGYRILITSKTVTTWNPPLHSMDGIVPGDWMEYKGRQRPDGVIEAESVKVSSGVVGEDEQELRKKHDFDPSTTPPDARQNKIKVVLGYTDPRRIPLFKNPAMQARVSEIGNRLVPAYQRALPDADPAKIHFRFELVNEKNWHDALTLPSGIIFVPRQVVERMQNDSQLATVLADNMACALEKQQYRFGDLQNELSATSLGAEAIGWIVPGADLIGEAAAIGSQEIRTKELQQSGRVSLGLLHDAGYDINQAPIAWWLLAANKPEPISKILVPYRAAYVYRAIGENWQTADSASSKR
jgi:hypothetical protein